MSVTAYQGLDRHSPDNAREFTPKVYKIFYFNFQRIYNPNIFAEKRKKS